MLVVLALCLAVVGVAACGGSDEPGGSSTKSTATSKTSVFRIGTTFSFDSLNPFIGTSLPYNWGALYIFPHLVQYNAETVEIEPWFARSWETSDDGLTRTFTLVDDAKWTDGKPVTAEDAAWTISTMIKYQTDVASFWQSAVGPMESAKAEGPNTLVVTYKAVRASALDDLFQLPILPKHIWEKYDTNGGKGLRTFHPEQNMPIVGSGPFVATEYTKDQSLILERNDDHWGAKPAVKVAGFQFFTSDDAAVTALKNNEIDYLVPVPGSSYETLKSDESIVTTEATPNRIVEIAVNSNEKKTVHRELLDARVKLALDHAIPREQIIELAFNGLAEPAGVFVPPATGKYHNSDVEPTPYDIDEANRILDELGYERGADGIRRVNGEPMSYPIIAGGNSYAPRMVSLIADSFKQIGVKVTLRNLPSTAIEVAYGPDNKYLTSDFFIDEYGTLVDPTFMLSVTTCAARGGQNDSGYCNAEYDAKFERVGKILDEEERLALIHEMQEDIHNERTNFFIAYTSALEAHRKGWDEEAFKPVLGMSLSFVNGDFLVKVRD